MADQWQDYFVPRRFQALELPTALPEEFERVRFWRWGPQSKEDYQPLIIPGNFLVREYNVGEDLWEYKVVRRENFLEYYQKGTGDAKQNPEAGSHDGGGRAQSSVRQEDGHSTGGGKGVQSGGRGETQGKTHQQEVAVAYACTVDGWVQVPARAIRNPESPHLVWMLKSTWDLLASHADIRGLFFIPCETAPDAQHLRMLVNAQEIADAS